MPRKRRSGDVGHRKLVPRKFYKRGTHPGRENLLKVRFSHFLAVLAQNWKSPKQLKIASWVKTNGFIESGVSESSGYVVPNLKTDNLSAQIDQHPISLSGTPEIGCSSLADFRALLKVVTQI